MWICPQCGREFKRMNQSHYCGQAPKTVDEYIELQPLETQRHLRKMRNILLKSVPCLKERILWSMPYYEKDGQSISFAACQKHISLYVGEKVIEKFASHLTKWQTKKNAIYFPYNQTLPDQLIETIARYCLQTSD